MNAAYQVVRDERGRPLPLIRLVGKGGQASVWASEGRIAVKLWHARTRRAAERLRSRIGVVRRLDLAGVPVSRPLELLALPEIGYSMELLEDMTPIQHLASAAAGRDLLEWYAETGGLPRRLRLLAQTADAFASLHARGVVYADPSPANVLVSCSQDQEEVRLIDVDFLQSESVVLDRVATPGYAAPEVITGRGGVTGSSDAFAFAVIAFETLTLAHPFLGDQVHNGDPDMLERAYAGELPWIDHPEDESNRSRYGLPRPNVLASVLQRLATATFVDGQTHPRQRPSIGAWSSALHGAADMALPCAGCPQAKDARLAACPWCGTPAPDPLVATVHVALPDQAEPVSARAALAVPTAEWLAITGRTAYLDRTRHGPEPAAWLLFRPADRLTVRNPGPAPLWLTPQRDESNVIVVEAGDELSVPADATAPRWAVHFGLPQEPHRLIRFFRLRTRRSET